MDERDTLLTAIAETIQDYREGEIPAPTPDHVDRWVQQFENAVQVPLLRELDHVLKQTYFSRARMAGYFDCYVQAANLAGDDPAGFWRTAHFLDIQKNGRSQTELLALFGQALHERWGLNLDECGADGGPYVYLDDVMFSGSRVRSDLGDWIAAEAPQKADLHIVLIAAYTDGCEYTLSELKAAARKAGKDIHFRCWRTIPLENRRHRRDDVYWPCEVPSDAALNEYIGGLRWGFEARNAKRQPTRPIFSSEEGRQLIERELLMAGMRIRAFSKNPAASLLPLGFGGFGLGFGSTIVTYRNCPNNAPLALWWGDPGASPSHPFSKWYPLVPRKTYEEPAAQADEIDFDDFF